MDTTHRRLDAAIEVFLNDAFRRVAVRLVARGFREEMLIVGRESSATRPS